MTNRSQAPVQFLNQSQFAQSSVYQPAYQSQAPQKQQIIIDQSKNDLNDEDRKQLLEEIENWKRKYLNLEAKMAKFSFDVGMVESTEEHITKLTEENKRLRLDISHKVTDNEQLRVQCGQLDLENHDLKLAKIETQRHQDLLKDRIDEINELRSKCSNLDSQLQALSSFELTLKEYENRIEVLKQEIELWKQRYSQQQIERQTETDELKGKLTNQTSYDFDEIKDNHDQDKQSLQNHIQGLQDIIKNLQNTVEEQKNQFQDLQSDSLQSQQKLKEYSLRAQTLKTELDRLNEIMRIKVSETDSQKIQIQQLQGDLKSQQVLEDEMTQNNVTLQNKQQECNELKQLNSELLFKVQELNIELQQITDLQNKLAMISSEIERLKKKLENRSEEVDVLKQKCQRYEQQIEELRSIEQDKFALENKCAMLASEIERMRVLLKSREQKIEEMRVRNQDSETDLKTQEDMRNEIRDLKDELDRKDQEIAEWISKYEELAEIQVSFNQADGKVFELEKQLAVSDAEFQRIQSDHENRTNELEQQKSKNQLMDNTLNNLAHVDGQNLNLKEKLQQALQDLQDQENQIQADSLEITEQRKQISQQSNELISSNKDVEQLTLFDEQQQRDLSELRQKYLLLQNDLVTLQEAEGKISNLESSLAMLSSELQRLGEKITNRDNQIQDLKNQVNDKEEVNRQNFQLQEELQSLKENYERVLQSAENELTLRNQTQSQLDQALAEKFNLENKIAMLSTEIERFQYKLKSRQDENDQQKQQKQELEQQVLQFSQTNSDNERLIQSNEQLKVQLNDTQNNFNSVSQQLQELQLNKEEIENKLAMMASEIERLQNLVKSKQNQIDGLKQEMQEQEKVISELKQIEQKVYEYETKLAFLSQEIERQTNIYKVKVQEIQNLKNKQSELENMLFDQQKMQVDLERLQTENQIKDKESQDYKGKMNGLEDNITRLENTKYQYESKLALFSSEIERQNIKYQNIQAENTLNFEKSQFLETELDKNFKQLDESNQLLDEMKFKYTQLTTLQNQLNQHQSTLVDGFQQMESLRGNILGSDSEISKIKKSQIKS